MIEICLSWNVLLFSCNPIGKCCLGGPSYSSRTVRIIIQSDYFAVFEMHFQPPSYRAI